MSELAAAVVAQLDQLAYRPKQAAPKIGLSLSQFWIEVAAGRIRTKKVGRRATLVTREELLRYLADLPDSERS